MEVEALTHSWAEKIGWTWGSLCQSEAWKREQNYRLLEKHKVFSKKAEWEKTELAESHAAELTKLGGEGLDLETRSYIEYHQSVRR
jgi:hypothetical protein